jgi:hypothetical protein
MREAFDPPRQPSRPAQIVRVAQRLKRQLNQALSERDQAFEERDCLMVLVVAYEAMLGTVLSPDD